MAAENQNVKFKTGESHVITILNVKKSDGTPKDLAGAFVEFWAGKKGVTPVLHKKSTDAVNSDSVGIISGVQVLGPATGGWFSIEIGIAKGDTTASQKGKYPLEVWVVDTTGRRAMVSSGVLELVETIANDLP